MDHGLNRVLSHARQLAKACRVSVSALEYASRDFLPDAGVSFCARCSLHHEGGCDFRNTHLYGAFEADRWGGLYIYYCPLTLGFIATTVYAEGRAEYALVTGPVVIGSLDDMADMPSAMVGAIRALPCRAPEETTALSRLQKALCDHLSGCSAAESEADETARVGLRNSLYAVTGTAQHGRAFQYPIEIEKQLQRMIVHGNRKGAQELINQLLGQLYFSENGNFQRIRENAKALMVLFSRAAIDGMADARQIFGDLHATFEAIDGFRTLDDLSRYLTSMFYRFVGYVFDFGSIRYADIAGKAIAYVRTQYAEKITLDDLAAHVHLSRPYLSRVLAESLGMPFTEYLNAYRIERSLELLEISSIPIAEVAHRTGFGDQSYFTRVFSRRMGISPREYRRHREDGGK